MTFPWSLGQTAAAARLASTYNAGTYDSVSNPGGFGQGGHITNFIPALQDVATVGQAAADAATAASTQAARTSGTSSSSVVIGTGLKSFTTQADKMFDVGAFLVVRSAANPTLNWMFGQVNAYSGTSLSLDVQATGGSGTFSDWLISLSGARGAQGPAGPSGTMSAGTVTALASGVSPTFVNAGTSTAAIWNIGIPRGDTGPAALGGMWVASFAGIGSTTFASTGSGGPVQLFVQGWATQGDCPFYRMKRVSSGTTAWDGYARTQSADGQWWELVPDGNKVYFTQMGAIPDDTTDCYAAWVATKAFLIAKGSNPNYEASATTQSLPELHFAHPGPAGFYFSDTLVLKGGVFSLIGQGTGLDGGARTVLRFATAKTGIVIDFHNTLNGNVEGSATWGGAGGSKIEGLMLWKYGSTGSDTGIVARARCELRNIFISSFGEDGITVYADAQGGGGGNANCGRLDTVAVQYCGRRGIAMLGADANTWEMSNISVIECGQIGFSDETLLGVKVNNLHLEMRWQPNRAGKPLSAVRGSDGWVYTAIQRDTAFANVNSALAANPPVIGSTTDYWWRQFNDPTNFFGYPAHSTSGSYYPYASLMTTNTNSRSVFGHVYVEGGGPASVLRSTHVNVTFGLDECGLDPFSIGNVFHDSAHTIRGVRTTDRIGGVLAADRLYSQMGGSVDGTAFMASNLIGGFPTGNIFLKNDPNDPKSWIINTYDGSLFSTVYFLGISPAYGGGTGWDKASNGANLAFCATELYVGNPTSNRLRRFDTTVGDPTGGNFGRGDQWVKTLPNLGGFATYVATAGSAASGGSQAFRSSWIPHRITTTFDPPSLAAGAKTTVQTLAATGYGMSDFVVAASFSSGTLKVHAWIGANNTIHYYLENPTAGTVDMGSGTVVFMLMRDVFND